MQPERSCLLLGHEGDSLLWMMMMMMVVAIETDVADKLADVAT